MSIPYAYIILYTRAIFNWDIFLNIIIYVSCVENMISIATYGANWKIKHRNFVHYRGAPVCSNTHSSLSTAYICSSKAIAHNGGASDQCAWLQSIVVQTNWSAPPLATWILCCQFGVQSQMHNMHTVIHRMIMMVHTGGLTLQHHAIWLQGKFNDCPNWAN